MTSAAYLATTIVLERFTQYSDKFWLSVLSNRHKTDLTIKPVTAMESELRNLNK